MYDPFRIDWSSPAVAAALAARGLRLPASGRARIGLEAARSAPGAPSQMPAARPTGRQKGQPHRGAILQPVIEEAERALRTAQRVAEQRPNDGSYPLLPFRSNGRHIAELAEQSEAGGRNPGMINPGHGDRGGASYGLPQLAANSRQPQMFLESEGRRWAPRFQGLRPGTPAFDRAWTAVAAEEPEAFGDAQRAYAGRNHYSRAVEGAFNATGLNLDSMPDAVRAAAWSTALQHGRAPDLLASAISSTDKQIDRASPLYAETLIKHIYDQRTGYLERSSDRNLQNVVKYRYPEEWQRARALLPRSR